MEQTLLKKQRENEELDNYAEILKDVKSILENAKCRAYKAVDNLRVQAYWQIGERIMREELQRRERANYGERLVENLAADLDIAKRNLYNSVKLYMVYPILHTVCAQLSWSHLRVLIYMESKEKRKFYESHAVANAWSVRELREQIQNNLYERMQKEGKIIIVPQAKTMSPEKIFKDSYNFEFLNLLENHSEEELKAALMNRMENFLHELGSDFFVGKRETPLSGI
ncbi:MAG: DUF1016 family protein [Nanoarchaeota archaeon]|nr:DUF1016 family protein [Nanoarchaeota archaeon]